LGYLKKYNSQKLIKKKERVLAADEQNPEGHEGFLQRFDDIPLHQYLGLTLAEVKSDYGRLRLLKTPTTPTGIGGSVNGGVLATMVDMAAIVAIFSRALPGTEPAGTADLSITYLRQAQGEWVDAIATIVKRGRQLSTVDVSIVNDQGVLCCRGRVLYAMHSSK
jgi:uncharacterized protein (TIGR00369 family)